MQAYVIEDDLNIQQTFVSSLERIGFNAMPISEPHAFFHRLADVRPGLIVLDWNLPEMDGISIIKDVRRLFAGEMPILMVSSRDAEEDVIDALSAGADDYMTKPVSEELFAARVRALQRRSLTPQLRRTNLRHGPLEMDYASQSVRVGGKSVSLAAKEFDVLWKLVDAHDRFVSKTELIAAVWGRSESVCSHTLAQHMHSIRQKCGLAAVGYGITSVYGTGYRLEAKEPAASSIGVGLAMASADALAPAS